MTSLPITKPKLDPEESKTPGFCILHLSWTQRLETEKERQPLQTPRSLYVDSPVYLQWVKGGLYPYAPSPFSVLQGHWGFCPTVSWTQGHIPSVHFLNQVGLPSYFLLQTSNAQILVIFQKLFRMILCCQYNKEFYIKLVRITVLVNYDYISTYD